MSKSRNLPYYYNASTRASIWEPPEGTDSEKLKAYLAEFQSQSNNQSISKDGEPEKIRASHLLIKHKDSRRPSSWKEEHITRTKEDAIKIILAHEARIRSGSTSLAELARKESDCSSAHKGGDLGYFTRDQMQKPFADAAFALKPGEVSHVVETDSGVHLIERTA